MSEKSNKSQELYLICHAHWDREWYLPFQQFRMHLVHLVDQIIKICHADPTYLHFNLDCQTIVIEDYLEIRPEMKEILLDLIKANRIGIGPWYDQPDEWTDGELLTRNLLRGYKLGKIYGQWQKIGYLPDSFGHPSQMPQIFQGVGIDYIMYGRGLGDEYDDPRFTNEYYWKGPDGNKTLTFYMPGGYANAKNHPTDEIGFNNFILFTYGRIDKSFTGIHFIGSGGDHYIPQKETPRLVKAFNEEKDIIEELKGGTLHFANLTEFMMAMKARIHPDDPLMTIEGELRQGRTEIYEPGSVSSRMYLKQLNATCWRQLCYAAEPLDLWIWGLSNFTKKQKSFIDFAWKLLLQNQPHDSICGCSVDYVHREMETRFASCLQIAEELMHENLEIIQMGLPARPNSIPKDAIPLVYVIPHVHSTRAIPEVLISNTTTQMELSILQSDKLDLNKTYELRDAQGGLLKADIRQILYRNDHKIMAVTWIDTPSNGLGYRVAYLCPKSEPTKEGSKESREERLEETTSRTELDITDGYENSWARIRIHIDGSFDLFHKDTKLQYKNLHYFCSQADAGDGYDFYGLPTDIPITDKDTEAEIKGYKTPFGVEFVILENMQLPVGLNQDRTFALPETFPQPISYIMTVWDHIPRIDFKTTIYNKAKDCRLRAIFPTPITTDHVFASSIYDVVNRGIGNERFEKTAHNWTQKPVPTSHLTAFVDIHENNKGSLALFNKGLPEYEARRENGQNIALCQTLYRAFRYEGGIIPNRGRAGDAIPVPDGQLQREMVFEYAIYFHSNNYEQDAIFNKANEYILPIPVNGGTIKVPGRAANQYDQFDDEPKNLPPEQIMLSISNPNVIMTTFKQAEQGNNAILRVFNPTMQEQTTKISVGFPFISVRNVNLLEEPIAPDPTLTINEAKEIEFKLPAKRIYTLAFELNAFH